MAHRNVGVTPGAGDFAAFDGYVQRVKLTHGAEGTQSDVSADAPLPINQDGFAAGADLLQLAAQQDGFPVGGDAYYGGTYPSSRSYLGGFSVTSYGEAFYCSCIALSTSRLAELQLAWDRSPVIEYYSSAYFRSFVNGSVIFPVNRIIHGNPSFSLFSENGDNSAIVVKANAFGWRMADDINLFARRTILWIGDSIARCSGLQGGAACNTSDVFTFSVRNWLCANGYDYRLIQKAQGSCRTDHAEIWKNNGLLDTSCPSKVGIVMYNMGANDYTQPATALANLQLFIPWALTRYPRALIVVCGPSPAENDTVEAGIVSVRTNFQSVVNGLANSRVQYLNLGSAFNRKDASNYSTADSAGSRIHPSVQGMAALTNVITAFLATAQIP